MEFRHLVTDPVAIAALEGGEPDFAARLAEATGCVADRKAMTIDLVVAGRHTETVQDEDSASYEGWCRDAEARINWNAHLDSIHNLIRGCDPAPGAWTAVLGQKMRLFDSCRHAVRRFGDVAGKPGTIVAIGDQTVSIAVQGGTIEIGKVRTESGQKSSAGVFARSHGLSVGDYFESEAKESLAVAAG